MMPCLPQQKEIPSNDSTTNWSVSELPSIFWPVDDTRRRLWLVTLKEDDFSKNKPPGVLLSLRKYNFPSRPNTPIQSMDKKNYHVFPQTFPGVVCLQEESSLSFCCQKHVLASLVSIQPVLIEDKKTRWHTFCIVDAYIVWTARERSAQTTPKSKTGLSKDTLVRNCPAVFFGWLWSQRNPTTFDRRRFQPRMLHQNYARKVGLGELKSRLSAFRDHGPMKKALSQIGNLRAPEKFWMQARHKYTTTNSEARWGEIQHQRGRSKESCKGRHQNHRQEEYSEWYPKRFTRSHPAQPQCTQPLSLIDCNMRKPAESRSSWTATAWRRFLKKSIFDSHSLQRLNPN